MSARLKRLLVSCILVVLLVITKWGLGPEFDEFRSWAVLGLLLFAAFYVLYEIVRGARPQKPERELTKAELLTAFEEFKDQRK